MKNSDMSMKKIVMKWNEEEKKIWNENEEEENEEIRKY